MGGEGEAEAEAEGETDSDDGCCNVAGRRPTGARVMLLGLLGLALFLRRRNS
jgi:MYXO-CTERM domain-containing protein